LKEVIYSFQQEKISGMSGWNIEFYMGFYEIMEDELLALAE
jgi:hypothetical protein